MTFNGLQVVRGIGCCFVIGAHVYPQKMIGYFSIDIFFLISAFFMAMLITMPSKTGISFAKERVARVIPLYWLLTFGVFFIAMFAPSLVGATTVNYGNLLKSLLFIPHYKENGLVDPVLAVGWTINYEMLFYLFCTLAFLFPIRVRIPFVMVGVSLVYLVANCLPYTNALTHFWSSYYLLEFPLGMLLWVLYRRLKDRINLSRSLLRGLMAAALVFMVCVNWRWDYGVPLYIPPALVLIFAALLYEPYMRDSPLTRIAVRVGDASYSIYLTHMFIIVGMRKLMPKLIPGFDLGQPIILLFCLVCCLLLGLLVDRYFDKPVVKMLRDRLKKAPARPQGATSA